MSTINIVPLHPYERENALNRQVQKYKYYIIENYSSNNGFYFNEIKEFAFQHIDSGYDKYADFVIVFYKESQKLHADYKETESDRILWHGDEIVYTFAWAEGKYIGYNFYSNGNILKKGDYIIRDN